MRFLASWLLYATGDLLSEIVQRADWTASWLYPVYNKLLLWSETVQGEGSGPWKEAE